MRTKEVRVPGWRVVTRDESGREMVHLLERGEDTPTRRRVLLAQAVRLHRLHCREAGLLHGAVRPARVEPCQVTRRLRAGTDGGGTPGIWVLTSV